MDNRYGYRFVESMRWSPVLVAPSGAMAANEEQSESSPGSIAIASQS